MQRALALQGGGSIGDLTTGFGFGRGRTTGALKDWNALDELEGEAGAFYEDAAVEAQAIEVD